MADADTLKRLGSAASFAGEAASKAGEAMSYFGSSFTSVVVDEFYREKPMARFSDST